MEFICTHCHKPIYTVAIILDKTHFIHDSCIEAYNNSNKEEIVKDEKKNPKWIDILKGFKIKKDKSLECCE